MSKPSLVLVHGSWHCPEHFRPLIQDLETQGYKCVPVSLPSTQSPDLPPATLTDDTVAVRTAVQGELDQGNSVVVVAHSYGGTVANTALENFDRKTRSSTGFTTSVLAIAFICAIPIPKGMSLISGTNGTHSKPIHDLRTPDFAWVGEPGPEYIFYNDLPAAEAKKWSDLLRPQSWAAYGGETTHAAYMDIPSSYLYCTEDRAFPYATQKLLVGAASQAGAKFVYSETFEASHSPFLSMVGRTCEFIRKVAGG